MAKYAVNEASLCYGCELIDARRYVLRSRWGDVQPSAADGTRYLKTHTWDEYGAWHLGLTEGATDETKRRYAFVLGDFRQAHRMGIISCYYRAAEYRSCGSRTGLLHHHPATRSCRENLNETGT